ncbi:DUF2267 domain-containing protein [Marinitenerispora sediminis]|uniref:DUF2267 domain-containing protein n=1 Tax=Marinitenerispora sediminis TaxID=1931232 RepID=A0A368T132_9ACTN|nr:DUF2267 domain-containing protein [Marinitenerispora sediminis]RCV49994.1 DUF2267 domain-containing protein [Marinitenerispora sediminis]RCV51298.1 DUF2267 domain-containing protein [Marinitenerispora sediminis]RCV53207.1 DUF2267 domain-containing protein [Marinitenerispora sediminis]
MQHDEFIGHVQDRARLASRGEAERAARATLQTLAERLPSGLARNLAGQLPIEIGDQLETAATGEAAGAVRFGEQEFFDRVAERAGTDRAGGGRLARAVCAVTCEAVDQPLRERTHDVLPEDMRELFPVGAP